MIKICVGAWGEISLKANAWSSSYTISEGICFEIILSKIVVPVFVAVWAFNYSLLVWVVEKCLAKNCNLLALKFYEIILKNNKKSQPY